MGKPTVRRTVGANLFGVVAVAPVLALLVLFTIYPVFQVVNMSFSDWGGFGAINNYVGTDNYQRLWNSGELVHVVWVNILYAAIVVPITVVVGFLLALAIHQRIRGWRFFRVVWFIPVVIPSIVVSFLWAGMIYAPTVGLLDTLVQHVGLSPPSQGWLGSPSTALPAVMATAVWQSAGWPMIVLLAGMSSIPNELVESARLDGATGWQVVRYVTVPLLRPVLASVIMLQLIFSLKAFDIIFVMTRGGPGDVTRVMGISMYEWAFYSLKFGMAAAVAVVMLVVITTISLIQRRFGNVDSYDS